MFTLTTVSTDGKGNVEVNKIKANNTNDLCKQIGNSFAAFIVNTTPQEIKDKHKEHFDALSKRIS